MLLATEIPTDDERARALELVPWRHDLRWLAVGYLRALRYGAVNVIDSAMGAGEGRAIVVAAHEGLDRLLHVAWLIAESAVRVDVFDRIGIIDPLIPEEPLPEQAIPRTRARLARMPVEDAILRYAAAGNDLANAHVRLAWEANAMTTEEAHRFDFRPDDPEKTRWATVEHVRAVLKKLDDEPLSMLRDFELNDAFLRFAEHEATIEVRGWRDQLAHRERLAVSESPTFGRTSLWAGPKTTVTFPAMEETDPELPTIAARRERLAEAAEVLLRYAEALWAVSRRFYFTVGVEIIDDRAQGMVRARINQDGSAGTAPARELRDPVPFLRGAVGQARPVGLPPASGPRPA